VLALEDKWIWDFWLARDGDDFHIFHLQADKALGDENLRHVNARSLGHAVSKDLENWNRLGTCFSVSDGPAFDDMTIWTGSVVRDEKGLWHLFYTGNAKADACRKQRIGHAASTDLHHWSRAGDGLALDIDATLYEEYLPGLWDGRAMRDPWVMADPDGSGWIMYFTGRVPEGEDMNARGCIGFARSDDLYSWTLEAPVYTGTFGQMEVPQVFKLGGRWYCIFCNFGEHWSKGYAASYPGQPVNGTHYLMADHHLGPWHVAAGAFLDGNDPCRRYAGKIIEKDGRLWLMAFNYWDGNDFFSGTIGAPLPVEADPETGLLRLSETSTAKSA
jgi:beta-fructofuranosidase